MIDSQDSLQSALLHTKKLSDNELANLCDSLCRKTIIELRAITKSVCVRLTSSLHKTDITDRLIAMARIAAITGETIAGDTGRTLQR